LEISLTLSLAIATYVAIQSLVLLENARCLYWGGVGSGYLTHLLLMEGMAGLFKGGHVPPGALELKPQGDKGLSMLRMLFFLIAACYITISDK
jgi:hypothetical protein